MRVSSKLLRFPLRKRKLLFCVCTLVGVSLFCILTVDRKLLRKSKSDRNNDDDASRNRQKVNVNSDRNTSDNNRNVFADNIHLLQNLLSEQNGPLCAHLRKPLESEINYRNKYWQAHEDVKNGEDIVVYSASYDDRKIVGRLPWIRVLGVRKKSNTNLWCYLWYSEFDIPIVTQAEILSTGRDHGVKGGPYSQRLISCILTRNDSIPTHVSMVNNLCNVSTISLPIDRPIRSNGWLHEFSICPEVKFGSYPVEWIVEWMELYSMFGVTKINLYNGSLDGRMDVLFDYYRKKGILEMRQMLSAVDDYSEEGIRLGSPASLNDCMMRNMYTTRFVVVVDLDEIIVPRVHQTFREMLLDIDRSNHFLESYHTYSFRMTYFFKFFPEDVSQPKFLQTMRLRQRTPPGGYLFGAKSFVDPRQCKSVFNHYCWTRFNTTIPASIDVNTSVALLHHYREKCPFKKAKCDNYNKNQLRDDVLLRYKNELMQRISKVLKAIGHSQ